MTLPILTSPSGPQTLEDRIKTLEGQLWSAHRVIIGFMLASGRTRLILQKHEMDRAVDPAFQIGLQPHPEPDGRLIVHLIRAKEKS